MKKSYVNLLASGAIVLVLAACSSTNTETATTTETTETVSDDATGTDTAGTTSGTAAGTDAGATTAGADASAAIDTTSFPVMAASSDMFELMSSKEAQTRGMHADVKKFAQQMITDHTKTSTELKAIAASKNLTLPGGPLPMHQRMLQRVTQEDAKEFDETYMEAQVLAHQQAVALFEGASKNEADPELKAFAAKHLPHLKMHLDMAKKTKDKVD